tara:strand:+ start:166 stop:456 length:291 start_codon:yes stop_codon:yes gene_type:complete
MFRKLTVLNGQTLEDIAIQAYGSIDGVGKIVQDNSDLSWDSELSTGQIIFIEKDYYINKDVVNYLKARDIKPATGSEYVLLIQTGDFNNDFNQDFS